MRRPFAPALIAAVLALLVLLVPALARAQTFPQLTGRVVDGANILPADEKARMEQKLAALETQSQRQLVVVTLPDLQGYDISDYGYQLGRHWGLGDKQRNDGAILIVAPKERKVRIEVGYGLEGTITDGLSSVIIQQQILPRFKAGDMPGGIEAGADALVQQLTLPADQAAAVAAQADVQAAKAAPRQQGIDPGAIVFAGFIILFIVIPAIRRAKGGRSYNGGSGLGPLIVFDALSHLADRGGGGGGWGGGGGSDWGGGGGFSGGADRHDQVRGDLAAAVVAAIAALAGARADPPCPRPRPGGHLLSRGDRTAHDRAHRHPDLPVAGRTSRGDRGGRGHCHESGARGVGRGDGGDVDRAEDRPHGRRADRGR